MATKDENKKSQEDSQPESTDKEKPKEIKPYDIEYI